ncbi:MAG: M4 family metallopeptidase, partial [Armatimonadetes bacterium]|nr:M4 family metallopeptidase [Anaerolineae bacterium]
MKRLQPISKILFVFVVFTLLTAMFSLNAAQSQPARTSVNVQTGKLTFVGASVANPVLLPQAAAPNLSVDARASAILDVYAPQFGAPRQDLALVSQLQADANRISRRYQQSYQGVTVFGAQVVVNLTRAGGLVSMQGKLSPDLAISVSPAISAGQAQSVALQQVAKIYSVDASTLAVIAPVLNIFDERLLTQSDARAALVWRVEVLSNAGAPIKQLVLVDAQTGYIALSYNQIHDNAFGDANINVHDTAITNANVVAQQNAGRAPGTADLATYDTNNSGSLPGVLVCDENDITCTEGADPDADSAHRHADGTYNMYYDWHNRDSLNGTGFQLKSTVHYSSGYCNAFWNSVQMAYGDGCPSSIVIDDVVGHELTHGVTEFTSGLIYAYQSGAINESFSDVWGEFYDITNGTAEDTPANRWRIGEEINFGTPGGGIRDMQDPTIFGDPDRYLSPLFYNGPDDSGGVHWNSGVNNKAAYLMADGATFNGFTVTSIGVFKTAAVYYDSQTTKLGPSSQYGDLYNALNQSCTELIGGADGITAADCTQVMNATLATEMQLGPQVPTMPVADVCETGAAITLFSDDFESGSANWITSAQTGGNA